MGVILCKRGHELGLKQGKAWLLSKNLGSYTNKVCSGGIRVTGKLQRTRRPTPLTLGPSTCLPVSFLSLCGDFTYQILSSWASLRPLL